MTTWLLSAVVGVLLLVAGMVPAWRGAARRRAATAGTTAYDVMVLGLPEVPGTARLRVGATSLVVDDPQEKRRFDFTATGLTLDRRYGDWSRGGERERTAVGRDGRGNELEITGSHTTMTALWDHLHDRPLPSEPRPPVTVAPGDTVVGAAFVAAGGLALILMPLLLVGAVMVEGTVVETAAGDELCVVQWVDSDGETRRNGLTCYEESGEEVRLWSLGGPLQGEVLDTDTPLALAFGGGGTALLGGVIWAYGVWAARRRARRAAAWSAEAADTRSTRQEDGWAPDVELPPADRVDFATARALMVHVARARAQHVWSDAERAEWREVRRALARLERVAAVLRLGPAVGVPLAVLVMTAAAAWTSTDGLLASRGPSATAVASVGEVVDAPLPLWPADVELTFTTGTGRTVEAVAAVADADALAPSVQVEYAVDAPYRVRVVGDPGPTRGVTLSAGATGLAVLVAAVASAVGPVRRRRALARAERAQPARLAYVLDRAPGPPGEPDADATGTVLLFDVGGAPAFRIAVAGDGVARAPLSGTAQVRGELREDAPVRCTLEDVPVRCVSGLLYLDPQEWLDDLRQELGTEEGPSAQQ